MLKTCIALLALVCAAGPAVAQTPASTPTDDATKAHTSDIGFSYSLPVDWEVVDTAASVSAVKEKVKDEATSEGEKRGADCTQVALTARHGTPPSVVVVVAVPFACLGQSMTEKDLPAFAGGTSDGIKNTFDVVDPISGSYTLGAHSMWIERAKANPKGHPETHYTLEIVCSLLKKGAVCWMNLAADNAALQTFERGLVELEGEAGVPLVPLTAFDKKPS